MADALRLRFGSPVDLASTLSNAPAFTAVNLSNAGHSVYGWATLLRAHEAATITHLGFRYEQRVGTPPTYRISMQGVSTSATAPDGTVLGGGSPASATFTPPADSTWNATWQWVALSNSYALTRGQLFAIVVEHSSGTINGSNFSQFNGSFTNVDLTCFPVVYTASAAGPATWTTNITGIPLIGYKSASAVYGFPIQTLGAVNYSVNSTPDEYALAFVVPATWFAAYTVMGVRAQIQMPPAGKTVKAILYSGTTVLQEVTLDTDNVRGTGNSGCIVELYFTDTTLATLTPGDTYRLAFQPQDTSTNINLPTLNVATAAEHAAWPGGTQCWLSTRTDAGAWSDDTTKRPLVEAILGEVTGGTVGGSSGGGCQLVGAGGLVF
jgi:hypothetical protein